MTRSKGILLYMFHLSKPDLIQLQKHAQFAKSMGAHLDIMDLDTFVGSMSLGLFYCWLLLWTWCISVISLEIIKPEENDTIPVLSLHTNVKRTGILDFPRKKEYEI